jgi:hypothetical protein
MASRLVLNSLVSPPDEVAVAVKNCPASLAAVLVSANEALPEPSVVTLTVPT